MKYQLPTDIKLPKKEEEKITRRINKLGQAFIKGFFWFITIPVFIYRKIKNHNLQTKSSVQQEGCDSSHRKVIIADAVSEVKTGDTILYPNIKNDR